MRVRLVAVQPDMRPEHYADPDRFHERILALAHAAVDDASDLPALVAFPELVAMPLSLGAGDAVRAPGVARAAASLVRAQPRRAASVAWRARRAGPSVVWHLRALEAWRVYTAAFGDAARSTGATIVAGSAFLPHVEREAARGLHVTDARVRNVSLVFGPTGSLLARIPKRHLMPRERMAGVTPGEWSDLRPVETPLGGIGVAVCLDAFHESVVERYDGMGARVLVQPSANHASWDRPWPPDASLTEGEAWLGHGLLSTIQGRAHLQVGVNPMLVGEVFGLAPQGRSSIVVNRSRQPGYACEGVPGLVAIAPDATGEAFVRATVDLR